MNIPFYQDLAQRARNLYKGIKLDTPHGTIYNNIANTTSTQDIRQESHRYTGQHVFSVSIDGVWVPFAATSPRMIKPQISFANDLPREIWVAAMQGMQDYISWREEIGSSRGVLSTLDAVVNKLKHHGPTSVTQ